MKIPLEHRVGLALCLVLSFAMWLIDRPWPIIWKDNLGYRVIRVTLEKRGAPATIQVNGRDVIFALYSMDGKIVDQPTGAQPGEYWLAYMVKR